MIQKAYLFLDEKNSIIQLCFVQHPGPEGVVVEQADWVDRPGEGPQSRWSQHQHHLLRQLYKLWTCEFFFAFDSDGEVMTKKTVLVKMGKLLILTNRRPHLSQSSTPFLQSSTVLHQFWFRLFLIYFIILSQPFSANARRDCVLCRWKCQWWDRVNSLMIFLNMTAMVDVM